MLALVVSPHTSFGGWLSAVQSVPVGAGVKVGVSGVPLHAGLVSQTVVDMGRLLASSIEVTPPAPLHTSCWQSPGVWSAGGSAVPLATFCVPQTWLVHVGVVQKFPVAGQSLADSHATQPSVASHTLPL